MSEVANNQQFCEVPLCTKLTPVLLEEVLWQFISNCDILKGEDAMPPSMFIVEDPDITELSKLQCCG